MRTLCTPSKLTCSKLHKLSIIIWTVTKTVHHVWILLVTKANVSIMKRCMPKKRSHTAHTLYALLVSHTMTVQGIRNDDQSLSPVTPLEPLYFLSFLIPLNVFNLLVTCSAIKPPPRPPFVHWEKEGGGSINYALHPHPRMHLLAMDA